MPPMTPQQYCHDICKKSGSNFVRTFYLLERKKRHALEAFYAFCRVVDDIVDESADVTKAREGLQHWRDEIGRLFEGKTEERIGLALFPAIQKYKIPREYFDEILTGCETDLTQRRYETFEALEAYCYRVASCVGLVSLHIFGLELTPQTKAAGIALGKALQLTNILREISSDLRLDRIYLPQDELREYDITENNLKNSNLKNENMLEFLYHQINRAQHFYALAWNGFPTDKKSQRRLLAARLMGKLYQKILSKIARDPLRTFHQKVRLNGLEKSAIVAKTLFCK